MPAAAWDAAVEDWANDASGAAWLCTFGGNRGGMRDNETWLLGPLGDAAGAMQVYLDLLSTGAMKPDHQLLQRKMKEATARLSRAALNDR